MRRFILFALLVMVGVAGCVSPTPAPPPTTQPAGPTPQQMFQTGVRDAIAFQLSITPQADRSARARNVIQFATQVQAVAATSSLNAQQIIQTLIQAQPNGDARDLANVVTIILEDQLNLWLQIDLTQVTVPIPQLAQAKALLTIGSQAAIAGASPFVTN